MGSVIPPPAKPAGSNTEVQYNNNGKFGASDGLKYDGSTLDVTNAIDLGAVGAGGRLECTQNNQDLQIKHTGSGKVEVVNATTDTDTKLQITGPGTGAANLTLSGASSTITFADGTTQTTAAAGGGGTPQPNMKQLTSGVYGWALNGLLPYGSNSVTISTWNHSYMYAWPFVAPADLSVAQLQCRMHAWNGTGVTARFTLWSSDSDNLPDTLLGYVDFTDSDGTGTIAKTTFYDSGGSSTTVSLDKDTLYWYSCVRAAGTANFQLYCSSQSSKGGMSGQLGNADNGGASVQESNSGWQTSYTPAYTSRLNWPVVLLA